MKKNLSIIFMYLLILFSCHFLLPATEVMAAPKISSIEQLEEAFKQPIKENSHTIQFAAPNNYTTTQIQAALERAAKSQNRLLAGSFQISKRTNSKNDGYADYKIELSDDTLMKVKTLKSKKAAIKAAAKALKTGKYSTNFYSETSYYEVFRTILQEHPEYNYGTAVWRSSNGAYGFQRNSGLTKKQQNAKMKAADEAASAAVKSCIKSKMTEKQKAKAIHDYIANHCIYGGGADAFTAYGALVDGSAVCQGYAAAFNLMAQKCGLQSMTVCGTTRNGAHAWTYVKTGKKYRYIDCTWDDTDSIGTGIVYTFFLVKADKMREEHIWNESEFPSSDIKHGKYFT